MVKKRVSQNKTTGKKIMSIIGTITKNAALTVSVKMANFGNVKIYVRPI